ncbi:MAG: MBL fold metallo-hydrolase [Pseudorhodobacter sp.]
MTAAPFRVTLWGVRGSLPVSGAMAGEFGGQTICIEMRCGDQVLIFDAGSGLAPAGAALAAEGCARITLMLTHAHYDHVIGLPFFTPFWNPAVRIDLWSGHLAGRMSTAEIVDDFLRQPFFPVGRDCFNAQVAMRDFTPGDVLEPAPGLVIRSAALNHPGGAVGYRVEWAGRVAAVVTDIEHVTGQQDPAVLALASGADLLLYDAAYEDSELEKLHGFGHSTWQEAIRVAEAAGAARLGLIHHAPWRAPAELARIEAAAMDRFAGAFCGRDGMVIDL